jgi:L-iditol 2-dehydrogenase
VKAARFDGHGGFDLSDVDLPKLGPDDVLIRTAFCGVCGTDVHKTLSQTVSAGTVLGHEVAGTVVATGSVQSMVKAGDRVVVAHHVPCFRCKFCQLGRHSLCPHYKRTNLNPGGFSEYFIASGEHVKHTLRVLPDDLDFATACLMEPLACVIQGQRRARVAPGDCVLVLGSGPIGALHIQLAKLNGAARIIVSDPVEWRREKACRFGADFTVDPAVDDVIERTQKYTDGVGVDVAIVCAGVPALLVDAARAVRRGGTVLLFAEVSDGVALPVSRFFLDEVTVTGSYSSSPYDYDYALYLLRSQKVNAAALISKIYPLAALQSAISMAQSPQEGILKILVDCSS